MLEIQSLASAAVAEITGGRALNAVLDPLLRKHAQLTSQQRAAVTDLIYGTLRYGQRYQEVLKRLLKKPLQQPTLHWLLLVALYQLEHTKAAPYAIVDHAVKCAAEVAQPQAKALVNGVLRNFLRNRESVLSEISQNATGRYAYPDWWISKLREQIPHAYEAVLDAGNMHPPFTLRVNARRTSPSEYLALLEAQGIAATSVETSGITLDRAMQVTQLPGFAEGQVSVQDAAAQRAVPLLDAKNGMRVLDACAAPGGKTSHLLELADVHVTALDNDPERLKRVRQNLERLGLNARLLPGDAGNTAEWWDGRPFDRVLADVPCSASGVVRRHPDIKWLRRPSDIKKFAAQQKRLLESLWGTLASGGKLLYTTCSIFDEENTLQIAEFIDGHPDAKLLPLNSMNGQDTSAGLLLPDSHHDGFFYALLQKT